MGEWTLLYSKLWWCAFRDSKVFATRAVYVQSDGVPLNHTNYIQALLERAYFDLCITQCIALVAVTQLGGDEAVHNKCFCVLLQSEYGVDSVPICFLCVNSAAADAWQCIEYLYGLGHSIGNGLIVAVVVIGQCVCFVECLMTVSYFMLLQ